MKQKTPEIGARTRGQIAENLPQAIERALESYHEFTNGYQSAEESKEFQSKHAAAKAALAHIELLLKLAALVDGMNDDQANNLSHLMAEARKELEKG